MQFPALPSASRGHTPRPGGRLWAVTLAATVVLSGCGGSAPASTPGQASAHSSKSAASGSKATTTAKTPVAVATHYTYKWVKRWDFRTAKTTLGWASAKVAGMPPTNGTTKVGMGKGFLFADVNKQDAWILAPDLTKLNIHGLKAPWFVMRVRVKTPKPSGAYSLDLYWLTTTNKAWGETDAVHTLNWKQFINTNGKWHTFAVAMPVQNPHWEGQLTALRVDLEEWEQKPYPTKVGANQWQIQYIGLASSRSAK